MPSPTDDLDRLLEAAVAAHRAGRLDEAEPLYGQVLARDPGRVRAAFNLGVLNLGRRMFDRAEALFAAVLAREPDNAAAWDSRINALIGLGRFADAEQAVAARPDRGPAAEVRLRQHWAQDLTGRRDFAAAEAQLQRVCDLSPADPDAFNDLARLHLSAGRPDAALVTLAEALRLAPDHIPSLTNQGVAYQLQGRRAEAEAAYRRALALDPVNVGVLRNLRAVLHADGRAAEAQALDAAALALGAAVADDHTARGLALRAADRHEDAIAAFEAALASGADRANTLARIGAAKAALGRYDEAVADLQQSVALRPDDPIGVYSRAFVRLITHDFEGGWPDYEWRWRDETFRGETRHIPQALRERLLLAPSPEQFAGRHVTVIPEQGVGDHIMFASVLPDLARVAAGVEVLCEPRLAGLFATSFPGITFRTSGGVEDAEVVVPMGSLAHAFRRRREDFPGAAYLRPRDEVRRRWAERLGPPQGRLRIGLSWRGGTTRTRTHTRSAPLEAFAPLLDLPQTEFVSLQYGDAAADVAAVNAGRADPIRLFPAAEIDDFEELAGLILNLDLVVSVQTAVAHLAGAVGAPALVMLPRIPEWRYGARGETMPWYGSVRLFRQERARDWGPVIGRIAETVRDWPR